jgi:ankyrin repeat protein
MENLSPEQLLYYTEEGSFDMMQDVFYYLHKNRKFDEMRYLLQRAIDDGYLERVRRFLRYQIGAGDLTKFILDLGVNLNFYYPDGSYPLQIAIDRNSQRMIRLLLEYGANPNYKSYSGETPLYRVLTSRRLDLEIIKILLEFGADPVLPSFGEITPINILENSTDHPKYQELLDIFNFYEPYPIKDAIDEKY